MRGISHKQNRQLPTCIEELKSGKKNNQHTPSPEARKTFKEDPVHSEVLIQEQPVFEYLRIMMISFL